MLEGYLPHAYYPVVVVDDDLRAVTRVDFYGIEALCFQGVLCPRNMFILFATAITAARELLNVADVNPRLEHAADAGMRRDCLGFGRLRRQSKVDCIPTPSAMTKSEACF